MKRIPLGVFCAIVDGRWRGAGADKNTSTIYRSEFNRRPSRHPEKSGLQVPEHHDNVASEKSDFMLQAWGWSGNYNITVFQHGGTAVYGTSTVTLSNAVKDVCHFLQSPQAQLSIDPAMLNREATPPRSSPPPQQVHAKVSADSLNPVRDALTNARDKLLKAANQSDYVQTAIARLDQALDDAKQAAAHINDDSAVAAPAAIPTFDAEPPPARQTNLMLYSSLNSLKFAYNALARVPGGDFGGYRTQMNDDMATAAAVLVNGIASYNAKHPH